MNLKNTNKLFLVLVFIEPGVFTLRLKGLGLSCFIHRNNMSALQRESIKLCLEKSEDGTNIKFHETNPSGLKIKLGHMIGLLYATANFLAPNLNNNSRTKIESKGIVDQRTTENNNCKSVSPKTHALSKIIKLSDSGTLSGYNSSLVYMVYKEPPHESTFEGRSLMEYAAIMNCNDLTRSDAIKGK